jgi:hypothetical protein
MAFATAPCKEFRLAWQTLHTLGAVSLDPTGFAAWWDAAVAAPANDLAPAELPMRQTAPEAFLEGRRRPRL